MLSEASAAHFLQFCVTAICFCFIFAADGKNSSYRLWKKAKRACGN